MKGSRRGRVRLTGHAGERRGSRTNAPPGRPRRCSRGAAACRLPRHRLGSRLWARAVTRAGAGAGRPRGSGLSAPTATFGGATGDTRRRRRGARRAPCVRAAAARPRHPRRPPLWTAAASGSGAPTASAPPAPRADHVVIRADPLTCVPARDASCWSCPPPARLCCRRHHADRSRPSAPAGPVTHTGRGRWGPGWMGTPVPPPPLADTPAPPS